jgi:hypothetical protein
MQARTYSFNDLLPGPLTSRKWQQLCKMRNVACGLMKTVWLSTGAIELNLEWVQLKHHAFMHFTNCSARQDVCVALKVPFSAIFADEMEFYVYRGSNIPSGPSFELSYRLCRGLRNFKKAKTKQKGTKAIIIIIDNNNNNVV